MEGRGGEGRKGERKNRSEVGWGVITHSGRVECPSAGEGNTIGGKARGVSERGLLCFALLCFGGGLE